MTRAFIALVSKDLKLFFTDRRAVVMSLVAPIAIGSFFGYIFSGDGDRTEIGRVQVLIVDEDRSPISQDLVAQLKADATLEVTLATPIEAREAVRRAKAAVAVELPPRFGADAARAFFGGGARKKAEVRLLYDPSRATEASMVQGILVGHVMQSVSKEMFTGPTGRAAIGDALTQLERDTTMRPDERGALQDLLRGAGRWNDTSRAASSGGAGRGLTIPFDVKKEAMTSRRGVPYNGYAHSFAGMGVQFILFMAIEMGLGLLLQQRDGLWRRLRAAPLSRGVLLGARSVSTALQSLFILFFMFLFARIVFGVRVDGSLAGFIGIAVAFSLMTASFGLLIAGLGRTPDGTRALSIVATLVLVMLGGAWVPTFVFPQWLQKLTVVVPTRWAIDGLDATTWRGLGFSSVAWPIVFLLGTAVMCGSLAVARFRWDAD